jgi:hypothetical protein
LNGQKSKSSFPLAPLNLPGVFGFSWSDDAPRKAGDGELLLCDRLSFLDKMALGRAEAALSREFSLALDTFRESDNYPRLFAAAAEEIKPEPAADSNGTEKAAEEIKPEPAADSNGNRQSVKTDLGKVQGRNAPSARRWWRRKTG